MYVQGKKEKFHNGDTKPKFLILFDPDTAGRESAPKFAEALIESGFHAVFHFLSNEVSKLDANDILREQGADFLAADIGDICNEAERALEELKEELQRFEDDLGFIISPSLRRKFAQLRKQPYSAERNEAMIQIIRENLDWKGNSLFGVKPLVLIRNGKMPMIPRFVFIFVTITRIYRAS